MEELELIENLKAIDRTIAMLKALSIQKQRKLLKMSEKAHKEFCAGR